MLLQLKIKPGTMTKNTRITTYLVLSLLLATYTSQAQLGGLKNLKDKVASKGGRDAFPIVWTGKTSSSALVYSCSSPNGNYALTTSKSDMSLIDGTSGKELWYAKFKDITSKGITSSNLQYVLWEANTLLVFDSKAGKNDRIAGINLADGTLMWLLDGYQFPKKTIEDVISYIPEMKAFAFSMPKKTIMVDIKSGEELWVTEEFRGAIGRHHYIPETGELVLINFMRNSFDAFAAGVENLNAIAKIKVRTGDIVWKSTHQGFGGKKFITKERMGELKVENDRVFVIYNGIQVFDLNSGKNIWSAYYNQDIKLLKPPAGVNSSGLGRKELTGATYDAIADPLITSDAVYVILQEKDKKVRRKYLQKYNLNSGELLWTSEKINDAKALPRLELVGNTVVAQIGGLVNQQYRANIKVPGSTSSQWTWVNEYVWVGKFGLRGFDAQSGTTKWSSDKFKARITKMAADKGNVYTASAKYFYSIDAANGNENYQVDFKSTKVGKPKYAFDIGEAVTIIGDKGVTAFNKKDGSALYSSEKIKKIVAYFAKGEKLYLQNEKDDLTLLDLTTGNTLGTVKIPKHNSQKKTIGQVAAGGDGNLEQYVRISELEGGADLTEDGKYIYVFQGSKIIKYQTD